MPASYCALCGENHSTQDKLQCERSREGAGVSRATRSSGVKMPKSGLKEEVVEPEAETPQRTLAEKRRVVQQEIEDLRLEAEIAELERERDRLVAVKLRSTGNAQDIQDGDEGKEVAVINNMAANDEGGTGVNAPDTEGKLEAKPQGTTSPEAGFTSTGRSRKKVKERRKRNSSSSNSTSRSASRRRRSKWTLRKFTVAGKEVRRSNCYELIRASLLWALQIKDLSVPDCRALFEHLSFLAHRAMYNDYQDSVHVQYDLAVRVEAETDGFAAFGRDNDGLSVMYYGPEKMRTKTTVANRVGATRRFSPGRKRACYAWNGDAGCVRRDDECRFGHFCSRCGSKSHRNSSCKE